MRMASFRFSTSPISVVVGCLVLLLSNQRLLAEDAPFLTEENGPFMVLARTFRGSGAEEAAKALASELRQEHKLPAYLLHGSDPRLNRPNAGGQFEEVAVFVGDAKSAKDQEILLRQVRLINPRCLAEKPYAGLIFTRTRLGRAMKVMNPLLNRRG